jgi:hypothetical protein
MMSAVSIGAASLPCHLLCPFSAFLRSSSAVLPQAESQKPHAAGFHNVRPESTWILRHIRIAATLGHSFFADGFADLLGLSRFRQ